MAKTRPVRCGWCNDKVVPYGAENPAPNGEKDGTCPRCGCSAVTPPWRS